jgi:hypothetical protein
MVSDYVSLCDLSKEIQGDVVVFTKAGMRYDESNVGRLVHVETRALGL